MLKRSIVLSLVIGAAMFSGSSSSFARERFDQILESQQTKQKMINGLREKISAHEKMSLSEIKEDLTIGIENTRKQMGDKNQITPGGDQFFQAQLEMVRETDDKDILIGNEKLVLESLVSSGNYMYALTRMTVDYASQRGASGVVFIAVVLIPALALDTAGFIFEFLASAFTGF